MDEKERRFISFQVTAEEAEVIENAANQQGLSRSEYLRQTLLAPAPVPAATRDDPLLHHLIYLLARLQASTYMIAERQGALPPATLEEVYAATASAAGRYLRELDDRIAQMNEQIRPGEAAA